MNRSLSLVLFVVALLGSPPVSAYSSYPFRDRRCVSSTGKTYVVIRQLEDFSGVSFELCQRRSGQPPMKAAIDPDPFDQLDLLKPDSEKTPASDRTIDRDAADRLIRSGRVAHLPLDVIVTDEPPGFFVLFENLPLGFRLPVTNVGSGTALTFVNAAAETTVQKRLEELFTWKIIADFPLTPFPFSGIRWNEWFWVDEARRRVLIAAVGDHLRLVSLEDGTVSVASQEVLIDVIRRGTTPYRVDALETAARTKPKGLREVAGAIIEDEAEEMSVRLRAAVVLRRLGSTEHFGALFRKALEKGSPGWDRGYAVAHLLEILEKDAAIPILRALMRGPADNDVLQAAQEAFVSIGEDAVPALTAMLLEKGQTPDYCGGAAHALGEINSATALEALLKAITLHGDYTASAAVNAAIRIGGRSIARQLAAILECGSTQDLRIAMYFEEYPVAFAEKPLEAALERYPGATSGATIIAWRADILEALAAIRALEK